MLQSYGTIQHYKLVTEVELWLRVNNTHEKK